MGGPRGANVDVLAQRLKGIGATVETGPDGGPVISVTVGGRPARAPAVPGHNSANAATAGQLKSYVERLNRLKEAAADIREDIKELGIEAKGAGFDFGAIREVAKILAEDETQRGKRAEKEAILETYLAALGVV